MKLMTALSLLWISLATQAVNHYYPTQYKKAFAKKAYRGETLRRKLFKLLSYKHIKSSRGKDDVISPSCTGSGTCYGHKILSYRGARRVLFGKLHLDEDSRGYFINDVYCRKKITKEQTKIGPRIIPNIRIINCEHTWPQSKFTKAFPKDLQRSDLHHLYPVDSRANSARGNLEFNDINGGTELSDCNGSYSSREGFEPPSEHKGNVARAIFYFSVRYKAPISERQEEALRRWHIEDPVDAEERERNNWIHKVQGNRNPFIDYPRLISLVQNF